MLVNGLISFISSRTVLQLSYSQYAYCYQIIAVDRLPLFNALVLSNLLISQYSLAYISVSDSKLMLISLT